MILYNQKETTKHQVKEKEVFIMTRNLVVEKKCSFCGKSYEIAVNAKDWAEFNSPNRRNIQEVFPYLTPAEREMFISGMCEECWDKMFSFDEEDEEDDEDFSEYEEYLAQTEISCEELKEVW